MLRRVRPLPLAGARTGQPRLYPLFHLPRLRIAGGHFYVYFIGKCPRAAGRCTFAVAEIAAGDTVEAWGQLWQGRLTSEYTADAAQAELAAQRSTVAMQWDDELFRLSAGMVTPDTSLIIPVIRRYRSVDAFTLQAKAAAVRHGMLPWLGHWPRLDAHRRPEPLCRTVHPLLNKRIATLSPAK